MAFDMGFDFRDTSGFVSDPSYAVPVLGEAYPHTYTNGDGLSINGGWTGTVQVYNAAAGNDARIAGINYLANSGSPLTFKVDLSSGSAPGAGDYAIDHAFGFDGGDETESFKIQDTSTVLIDGSANILSHSQKYIDATLTEVAATTNWTGTPVVKTFATTLVQVVCGVSGAGSNTCLAHFRLTLQGGGGGVVVSPRMFMLLGVGA